MNYFIMNIKKSKCVCVCDKSDLKFLIVLNSLFGRTIIRDMILFIILYRVM